MRSGDDGRSYGDASVPAVFGARDRLGTLSVRPECVSSRGLHRPIRPWQEVGPAADRGRQTLRRWLKAAAAGASISVSARRARSAARVARSSEFEDVRPERTSRALMAKAPPG